MPRNLDLRVELLVPVDDPPSRDRLISILKQTFKDITTSGPAGKAAKAGWDYPTGWGAPNAMGLALAIPPRARSVGFSVASLWVIPGLIILPIISSIERPLPLPGSITEAVLGKDQTAVGGKAAAVPAE